MVSNLFFIYQIPKAIRFAIQKKGRLPLFHNHNFIYMNSKFHVHMFDFTHVKTIKYIL